MFCQKCKQKKELFTANLCSSCLITVLEKRIKKSVKEQGGINRGERVLFLLDKSLESKVAKYFFEKIYSKLQLKVFYENTKFYDKIIIPFTSEKIISDFLNKLFEKKKFEINKKRIVFLESLTIEEVKDVAKIKNLKGNVQTYELLDKIEKKYPGSKHSLMKSIKFLEG